MENKKHNDWVRSYIESVSSIPYEELSEEEINEFITELDIYYRTKHSLDD